MDAEVELLLYAVAFGSGYSLYSVVRRKIASSLRFHTAVLAVLFGVSVAALAEPELQPHVGVPVLIAFLLLALGPSLVVLTGRRLTRDRRFALAGAALWTGATLLGRPAALSSEARLYGALAAAERGDEDETRRRLHELVESGGLTAIHGGRTLAEVMPLAGARRWADALRVIDDAPSGATAVLGIEVRAAAETGDLRRALRALARIEARVAAGGQVGPAVSAARRGLLSAAGRVEFLAAAARRRAAVVSGPRGTADLALGRACEARGDVGAAREHYATVVGRSRGALLRDARRGIERLDHAHPRVADIDEEELDDLLALEERTRASDGEGAQRERPVIATIVVSVITIAVSAAVFLLRGDDAFTLLAAGALSEPLVRGDGEWWRLFSAMLLHGGWLHLILNLSCIVVIGVLLERRLGAARVLIIYLGSGFAGSLASVYLNGTQIGVGASGGAMGLIGALLVLLLRRPGLFDAMERRRWTSTLWAGLVGTAAIGIIEAEMIDNAAHAMGAIGGALLAFALLPPAATPASGTSPKRPLQLAALRISAALLVGLAGAATYEAARSFTEWEGRQEVWAAGVRAEVPGWLRATHLGHGGVLLERPPAEIAVLLGHASGGPAHPGALFAYDEGLRALLGANEVPAILPEEFVLRPRGAEIDERLAPEWRAGVRVITLRAGEAFALVRLPVGDDAAELYAPVVDGLRTSLAPVERSGAD